MKKLIGWRTSDFLRETSDQQLALNWANHHEVLPIFEDDPNTALGGKRTGWPAEGRLMQDDHKGLSKALAATPEAPMLAREAASEISAKVVGILLTEDGWNKPMPKGLPMYPAYRATSMMIVYPYIAVLRINGKEHFSKVRFYTMKEARRHCEYMYKSGMPSTTFREYFE